MLKGDTALDMRGRCSAGQKVCIFVVFWIPPPRTNADAFTKKPNLLVFSPCILSWFNNWDENALRKGVIWNEGVRMLMSFVCDSVFQNEIFKMKNPSARAPTATSL